MLPLPKEEAPPLLTAHDFQRFADFFYRNTGILFGANKRYFVDRRLQERIVDSGHRTFGAYFDAVRLGREDGEYQALVNAMTINETYFYRELYQLDCLVNSMLPEVVKSLGSDRVIRIWSMPCSTGEEPYSIAFYLLEHWKLVDDYEIEIVASDIDTEALRKARLGVYSRRSLQFVPQATVAKYTTEEGEDLRRVVGALREFDPLHPRQPAGDNRRAPAIATSMSSSAAICSSTSTMSRVAKPAKRYSRRWRRAASSVSATPNP